MNAPRCSRRFRDAGHHAPVGLRRCARPAAQSSETLAPNEVAEFDTLYAENCAGCHGPQGRGGAAIALADPVYLRIADEASMRARHRQRRTRDVDARLRAKRRRHADGQADRCDRARDPIALEPARDSRRRPSAFLRCGSHGRRAARRGRLRKGTANPATVPEAAEARRAAPSRTIPFSRWSAIRGCARSSSPAVPELGAPDWRGNVPGRPMSDQEVTDVVAWLARAASKAPGQPYSTLE